MEEKCSKCGNNLDIFHPADMKYTDHPRMHIGWGVGEKLYGCQKCNTMSYLVCNSYTGDKKIELDNVSYNIFLEKKNIAEKK
ncbi:MAG: hypothetical protein U9Q66_04085 [Patescibacteria group bacterium]|nr:hypothetical protein [Patescibacteria group bacterium]